MSDPPHPLTLHDLRTQIIANACILYPHGATPNKASDDHLEVVVARAPIPDYSRFSSEITNWNEKDTKAMMRECQNPKKEPVVKYVPAAAESHYALLVVRGHSTKSVGIILKGEMRESPAAAVEWLLELTERLVHDAVIRRGQPAEISS